MPILASAMVNVAASPVEFVTDVFTAEVGGISLLHVTLAAVAVAAAIGVTRWAFNTALGRG